MYITVQVLQSLMCVNDEVHANASYFYPRVKTPKSQHLLGVAIKTPEKERSWWYLEATGPPVSCIIDLV
jgi:hypothetical protein